MFWTLVLPIVLSIAVYAIGKYVEHLIDGHKLARYARYQAEMEAREHDVRDRRLAFLIGEELERRASDRRTIRSDGLESPSKTMPAPRGNL